MRIGVTLPQREIAIGTDVGAVREFAQAAESIGYTYLRTGEHVLGANVASRPNWRGPYGHTDLWHEPFVLFGYLAGITQTLELVTSILIPNPPKDTDGRREESGRGVRELQGK